VTWVQLDYRPRLQLQPGESYTSEGSFVGAFRKEGVYLFKELGKFMGKFNFKITIVSHGKSPRGR
jgi:hypothetical protein